MRLAISNIAWDVSEDEDVARLLQKYSIDAIDIAPGKYFANPANATQSDMERVKHWWSDRGIEITGMQALLFGTVGLNVFGSKEVQNNLLERMAAVCRIGSGLGATRLVFGSPKNRDRTGLSNEQALTEAVTFFRHLGDIALAQGVIICLEPNPTAYGANFMTTSEETAHVVRSIEHPSIRMQLDTGAITMNNEDPIAVLQNSSSLIGHIHASEPNLLPLGSAETEHMKVSAGVNKYLPYHIVCIEMLATHNEPHVVSIERAITVAIQSYRNPGEGAYA